MDIQDLKKVEAISKEGFIEAINHIEKTLIKKPEEKKGEKQL